MSQSTQKPPSSGIVILKKRLWGWEEFPKHPRMVFRTRLTAYRYARSCFGFPIKLRWKWGIIPVPYVSWRLGLLLSVLAEPTSEPKPELGPRQNMEDESDSMFLGTYRSAEFLEDPDWPTVLCECGALWCKKSVKIPPGLYEALRKRGCIVRHKDCEAQPESDDHYIGQINNWQIWKDGHLAVGGCDE